MIIKVEKSNIDRCDSMAAVEVFLKHFVDTKNAKCLNVMDVPYSKNLMTKTWLMVAKMTLKSQFRHETSEKTFSTECSSCCAPFFALLNLFNAIIHFYVVNFWIVCFFILPNNSAK